ncbi:MAG: PEP-CTERM sorting domain-containing protein [Sedimentisphaeraceae bacterium JB056]
MFKKAVSKLILLTFLLSIAGFAEAVSIYHNDYSSDPKIADTGLSNLAGSDDAFLYISSSGNVTEFNPAGNNVYLLANRYREKRALIGANNIEESVVASSSAEGGVCMNYLSEGASVGSGRNYDGGDILRKFDETNPGDTYSSTGTKYLGFRISAGNGDYYYGWMKMSAFIKTEAAPYDYNQAQVTIYEVAIMDTVNTTITVGQTEVVPEPATLALFAFGACGLLKRRKK